MTGWKEENRIILRQTPLVTLLIYFLATSHASERYRSKIVVVDENANVFFRRVFHVYGRLVVSQIEQHSFCIAARDARVFQTASTALTGTTARAFMATSAPRIPLPQ